MYVYMYIHIHIYIFVCSPRERQPRKRVLHRVPPRAKTAHTAGACTSTLLGSRSGKNAGTPRVLPQNPSTSVVEHSLLSSTTQVVEVGSVGRERRVSLLVV